jgi:hypothetical protein
MTLLASTTKLCVTRQATLAKKLQTNRAPKKRLVAIAVVHGVFCRGTGCSNGERSPGLACPLAADPHPDQSWPSVARSRREPGQGIISASLPASEGLMSYRRAMQSGLRFCIVAAPTGISIWQTPGIGHTCSLARVGRSVARCGFGSQSLVRMSKARAVRRYVNQNTG